MRPTPEARHRRGRGPARILAALGSLLVLAALVVLTLGGGGVVPRSDAGAQAGGAATRSAAPSVAPAPRSPAGRTARQASADAGRPLRLTVPALGIAAPVTPIELDGTTLEPPADPQVVGWWSTGGVPGDARGTAVIAGHTVHTGGGAFDHLDQLRAGDVVRLTTESGTISYTVRRVTIYPKASLAARAARVFSPSAPGRLALVTCDDWNGTTYESNAVVLASPSATAR